MASKTPAEFRQDLDGLLKLAADRLIAEDNLTRRAREMRLEEGWHGLPLTGAVFGAVEYALNAADNDAPLDEPGSPIENAGEIAQAIQDAIDVVNLAVARSEEATVNA